MTTRRVYKVVDGKWKGEYAIVEFDTPKGYWVYLVSKPQTDYQRLRFSKHDIVFRIAPLYKRVNVQTLQETQYVFDGDIQTNEAQLQRKWLGKSRDVVTTRMKLR